MKPFIKVTPHMSVSLPLPRRTHLCLLFVKKCAMPLRENAFPVSQVRDGKISFHVPGPLLKCSAENRLNPRENRRDKRLVIEYMFSAPPKTGYTHVTRLQRVNHLLISMFVGFTCISLAEPQVGFLTQQSLNGILNFYLHPWL